MTKSSSEPSPSSSSGSNYSTHSSSVVNNPHPSNDDRRTTALDAFERNLTLAQSANANASLQHHPSTTLASLPSFRPPSLMPFPPPTPGNKITLVRILDEVLHLIVDDAFLLDDDEIGEPLDDLHLCSSSSSSSRRLCSYSNRQQ